jgi:hypothetical protein
MHSILNECKKTYFSMKFHPKILNFKIVLYLIDVYQHHAL